jgi:hypothetical protein
MPRRDRGGDLTTLRGARHAESFGAHRVGHRQHRGRRLSWTTSLTRALESNQIRGMVSGAGR